MLRIERCNLGLFQGGKRFTNGAGLGCLESRQLLLRNLRTELLYSVKEISRIVYPTVALPDTTRIVSMR